MEANFINSFISAASFVLREETRIDTIQRGSLAKDVTKFATDAVNVVIGITGTVQGVAIFSCDEQTALNIVNRMADADFTEFDDNAADGIAEMGNVITGRATILLEKTGLSSDLSPPTLITGVGSKISTYSLTLINIPLIFELGTLNIRIGLRKT